MKITKYPDGSSYVTTEHSGEQSSVFRVNTYEDLHHLEQFVDAFNNKYGERPIITIPCLIDAQADRRFADNQSSGLKIVCKRLNSMDADFKIFHPHNPEVVGALLDNVEIIDNEEFIKQILTKLNVTKFKYGNVPIDDKPLFDNLILMSSDAGGFKPLMKLCDKLRWKGDVFSAAKARSWDEIDGTKFTQLVDRSDFGGKDVLIIDDLSIGGGTFKGLSKLLKERNVGKLYLAVSHMTVQDLGRDPVTNYFDKVFCTNSKFDTYGGLSVRVSGEDYKNLEVIKMFDV